MLISLIFAWLCVVCAAMTALKFIARVSNIRVLNRFFHTVHIPFGVLLLVFGVIHAAFAGNPSGASLFDFTPFAVFFTLNWGSACFVCAAALAVSYLLRRRLKKLWMPVHRLLTVMLIICLVVHLVVVGIQLPGRLFGGDSSAQSQTEELPTDDESAQQQNSESGEDETGGSTDDAAAIVTFSGAVLADGSYSGSAQGYSGTTTVTVTVSGGQVSDITVNSNGDSPQFFSQAQSLLQTIVGTQSLQVDTVSGATFSSAGIINAVYNALQDAVVSGTLEVTQIDLSAVEHHGH